MEIVFLGLAVSAMALVGGAAVAKGAQRKKDWLKGLSAVAETFDLALEPGGWFQDAVVRGIVGRIHLTIDVHSVSTGKSHVRFARIRCTGGQPAGLAIQPEGAMTTIGKLFGVRDVEIGDPDLDPAAVLNGEPESRLRARMNAPTRAAVTRAVRLGAHLTDGWWTLACRELVTDPRRLVSLTRTVLDAAAALAADVPLERLAEIAATDPLPTVRRRALGCLVERDGPGDWLVPFTADPNGEVAVFAAAALGERARLVLVDLLGHGSAAVVRAAALALARLEPGADRSQLERALQRGIVDGDCDAIDALGRIGSVGSVPVLASFAESRLGLGQAAHHAKSAIRAIQQRLVGVETGTLALADRVDGGLSIADRPTGALTRSDRDS